MKLLKSSLLAATAAAGIFGASAAHAQAFYLQEQSVRGAGRAFSGEGADQGAQSLWWNPASIAGMDSAEVAVGLSAIMPSGKAADKGTMIVRPRGPGLPPLVTPVGGDAVTEDPIHKGYLPSGAIAVPLGSRAAIGIAVSAPYSMTTEYPATSWARYNALKTEVRTFDIQPSIAFAPTDWLRVGAALNAEYSKAELSNALANVLPTLPDGKQTLKGDGWDFGWTAGVQIHQPGVTVGLSYKSAIKHHLKGNLEVAGLVGPLASRNMKLNDVEATFTTPDQYILSGRFEVTPQLTMNGQIVKLGWSNFDAIRLGAPVNSAIPEEYRDSWTLAGGLDYQASPALTLRGGIQKGTTPIVERDARVPDSGRTNYALGASYRAGSHLTIDAAANYIAFKDGPITRRTQAGAGMVMTNGQITDANAIVLSLGGKFTF